MTLCYPAAPNTVTLYNSAFDLHFGHPSRIIWLEGGLEYA